MSPGVSPDLTRLTRWVAAGGHAEAMPAAEGRTVVSLCRCDGGEEVERFISVAADVRDWFDAHEA